MTQLTENLTVWELWYFKAVASYRGERFQIPTRHTGEYKVDLTRHPKFPLAFGELASGCFPHWGKWYETDTAMNAHESENYLAISRSFSASKSVEIFWAEIYRGQFFVGPNLVSFNRTVVPYEISKVNFRVETKILVNMSEEI